MGALATRSGFRRQTWPRSCAGTHEPAGRLPRRPVFRPAACIRECSPPALLLVSSGQVRSTGAALGGVKPIHFGGCSFSTLRRNPDRRKHVSQGCSESASRGALVGAHGLSAVRLGVLRPLL